MSKEISQHNAAAMPARPAGAAPDRAVYHGCEHGNPNQHPYRPSPDPKTGELKIDPDIVLKAKQFDLTLSFFYSSRTTDSREFGVGRGASYGGVVISDSAGNSPTVTRGDFREYDFTVAGASGGITSYMTATGQQATTTLSFDGTNFTEYFNDGMQLIYKAQVTGTTPVTYPLVQVKSPTGLVHTYTYGSGAAANLLQKIAVPGGNVVSFLYTSGVATSLLQTVQDWSNRRWTFQYDSQNYMTTMTTPLACQTGYAYSLAGSAVTLVQAITDPRGFTTSYVYNSDQQVVSNAGRGLQRGRTLTMSE